MFVFVVCISDLFEISSHRRFYCGVVTHVYIYIYTCAVVCLKRASIEKKQPRKPHEHRTTSTLYVRQCAMFFGESTTGEGGGTRLFAMNWEGEGDRLCTKSPPGNGELERHHVIEFTPNGGLCGE